MRELVQGYQAMTHSTLHVSLQNTEIEQWGCVTYMAKAVTTFSILITPHKTDTEPFQGIPLMELYTDCRKHQNCHQTPTSQPISLRIVSLLQL
jgi:hypothetical protein